MILRYHTWPLPVSDAGRAARGVLTDASLDAQSIVNGLNCPRVYITANPAAEGQPSVVTDFAAVGRLAYEHFYNRGFRNLAVFTTGEAYREDAALIVRTVQQRASDDGLALPVFIKGERTIQRERWVLDDQIADLADWLTDRSYPLGLVCVDDEHAWRAVEAATMAGLRVPEDVAILGVGDDECLCDSCVPSISSVALDHVQVGHEAAALLASLIEGGADPGPRHIQPIGVIERGSTSVLAIDDPMVARAMALIRDPEQQRWTINELAKALHTSPRTLYRRFISALGHPPGLEIRRARIEAARWWITHTDLKLVVIADRVGFPSISQLSRDIQREFGVRPSELRRRSQASRHLG